MSSKYDILESTQRHIELNRTKQNRKKLLKDNSTTKLDFDEFEMGNAFSNLTQTHIANDNTSVTKYTLVLVAPFLSSE